VGVTACALLQDIRPLAQSLRRPFLTTVGGATSVLGGRDAYLVNIVTVTIVPHFRRQVSQARIWKESDGAGRFDT
jgi:hypothetical protein